MRRDWDYYDGLSTRAGDIDPLLLLLIVGVGLIFFIGWNAGKTGEHQKQRRLGKIKGRINNIDPADVTDYRLSTIEDVLPEEKK